MSTYYANNRPNYTKKEYPDRAVVYYYYSEGGVRYDLVDYSEKSFVIRIPSELVTERGEAIAILARSGLRAQISTGFTVPNSETGAMEVCEGYLFPKSNFEAVSYYANLANDTIEHFCEEYLRCAVPEQKVAATPISVQGYTAPVSRSRQTTESSTAQILRTEDIPLETAVRRVLQALAAGELSSFQLRCPINGGLAVASGDQTVDSITQELASNTHRSLIPAGENFVFQLYEAN